MARAARDLLRRSRSLQARIEALTGLRATVALRPQSDITARQWRVIESQLASVSARLAARVRRGARAYLPKAHTPAGARALNALLGELELELSRAFEFFDTYMDVLTQRHTPEMGRLLAGCDALAWDCLMRDHPALDIIEPSLTYCDRGFGASTLREGVLLPHAIPNPMPLIEIPYSRLKEKCNLTSVLHEAGHEAMVRLGLTRTLPRAMREGLVRAGGSRRLQGLFALWSREIGPDFWGFCSSGIAAAATIREILALPPAFVFRVSWTDPHPPPYLRVLLSLECCRQTWGQGDWDDWERQWLDLYPTERLTGSMRALLNEARRFLPTVAGILLRTRFGVLSGRALPELFDLSALAPAELQRVARSLDTGTLQLKGLRPCTQLAVFRTIKERGTIDDDTLDRLMTTWLIRLGTPRKDSR